MVVVFIISSAGHRTADRSLSCQLPAAANARTHVPLSIHRRVCIDRVCGVLKYDGGLEADLADHCPLVNFTSSAKSELIRIPPPHWAEESRRVSTGLPQRERDRVRRRSNQQPASKVRPPVTSSSRAVGAKPISCKAHLNYACSCRPEDGADLNTG